MPENLPHDWEMAPRYRVIDSAVRCSHGDGDNDWQLHLIKRPSQNYSFLWMRPLDCGNDAGFIAIDENFDREWVFGITEMLQTQGAAIDSILGKCALARRFVLNTRGQLRTGNQRARDTLTLRRDGVAAWSQRQHWEGTPFRWRQILTPIAGADWVRLPAAQIWAELQIALADPNSEANFARHYGRLTPLERRARIQKPVRGSLDELHDLLRDVALASPQWSDLGENSELYLSVEKSGEIAMYETGRGDYTTLEIPDFVRENVRALWKYFQPFDRNLDFFLCARNSKSSYLFARAFRPSAHEQVEAQLRLRDWANAHLGKGQCGE